MRQHHGGGTRTCQAGGEGEVGVMRVRVRVGVM